MKKIYFLLCLFFYWTSSHGQSVIFSENIGSPSATTAIATYTGWQNNGIYTFSNGDAANPADIRNTSTSTGYTGASGAGNVYFTSTNNTYGFSIENINASSYTNLTLQFAYRKESATALANFSVDFWNGTSWVNVPFTFAQAANASTGWYLVPTISLPATAQINGLKLRWVKTGVVAIRIDDIILTGTPAASATLSASTLSDFGNICQNTTSASQYFTITGSNLTADVTVGVLTGYTYSTTSGGTYTSTLTLTPTSGAINQSVYVKFNPTAVQSYNGNISISGGGVTTPITVAVTGAGVNTAATVTTNSATAIAQTDATLNGSSVQGCSAITEYGFEYGTVSGTYPNTITTTAGTNFNGTISGLTSGTTYYYRAYVKDGTGTVYGTEQSFTTLTPNPTLSATALTAFGNVCINTTAGPNSFTITGSNLTNANVDIAPLAGFTYATTANGTYSNSLSLTQGGGAFSQTIYVKFTPTAVQSYSGDIVISGGDAASATNVAASGAGVSTPASVSTGSSSAVTTTTATLAGSIANTGCTTVTAYGIEYSTTSGFTNGSGTKVASSNLSGSNFTSALSGLAPGTTYYYKAYATNAGGTSYGAQQSFTTTAPPPPSITTTALTAFGNVCTNTAAGPNSFTINGSNLTAANITVGALAGYTYATTANGTYTNALSLTQTGGTYSQTVYVKFTPTATQAYNGNIPVSGGGFTSNANVAASGTGVNTPATVTTDGVRNITTTSATLIGTVTANGCSSMTKYGFEYSSINNFPIGTGTTVYSTSTATSGFTINLAGLVQGATYYYRAFATNNGGTSYGSLMSFTVNPIQNSFVIYPVPAVHGSQLLFSIPNVKAGYYALAFYNTAGQKVYQQEYNVQGSYINENFKVPVSLRPGVYYVQLVNYNSVIASQRITIF